MLAINLDYAKTIVMIWAVSYISESDKAFWGSIVGSLLGTVGAFLIAILAIATDRFYRKLDRNKESLREYNRRLIAAETSLNEYIPAMLKSSRLLKICSKSQGLADFMVTLPRTMELSTNDIGSFRNQQLVNEYLTLCLRAALVNHLIDDFSSYYKLVRDATFDLISKGLTPNTTQLAQDRKILSSFAVDADKELTKVIDDAFALLAILQLHGEIGKNKEKRFKDPKVLDGFKLSKRQINARIKKIKKQSNPERFFGGI